MRLLLLGYSAIVRKRVIPAVQTIRAIEHIDIASRSAAAAASTAVANATVFSDYDEALTKSSAGLVYLSLVNSAHFRWAEAALRNGRHVIVDKPACIRLDEARKLVELACSKDRCLAEATVYAWHPQIHMIRDLFQRAGTRPTRLTVSFSFPPLPENNFRYQKHLGGGALYDLGPYAVSPGRLFFNDAPDEVFCRICSRHPVTGVDTAFSMLAVYPGGCSMTGHFDFNTEYRNCMNILGPGMSVDVDRVFTTPPESENRLGVRSRNTTSVATAPAADAFALFMQDVLSAIETRTHQRFADMLLSDATALHRLRAAAGEE